MENRKFKLGVIGVVLTAFLGNTWVSYPDIMEIRNFVAAREMVLDGNWIIPLMNGAFRFEKPPLPTWITAGFMKIVGVDAPDWLLRFPSAFMGILFIYMLYKLIMTFINNEKIALLACFTGATTIMFTNLADENMWDIYNYVFAYISLFFIIKGIREDKFRHFTYSGLFLGASILSKGPVGIYILFLPFFLAYGFVYGFGFLKKYWKQLLFVLVMGILVAGIWPLAMYLKDSKVFYEGFFGATVNKEVATWTNRKQESIFYYLDYPAYTGIWMLPLVFGFFKKWSSARCENNESRKFLYMSLLWNLFIFLCLTSVGMKKKRYTLPLYMVSPMILGIICNYYLTTAKKFLKKSDRFLLWFQRILMIVLCLFIPVMFILWAYPRGTVSLEFVIFVTLLFLGLLIIPIKGGARNVIIGGGIIILLGNLSANWYIDRYFRNIIKKREVDLTKYESLSVIKKNPIEEEIYSFGPTMREVWNVGKKVKNLELPLYKNEENIPDEFILMTLENPEKIKDRLPNYEIVDQDIYYKEKNSPTLIYLYDMKKVY